MVRATAALGRSLPERPSVFSRATATSLAARWRKMLRVTTWVAPPATWRAWNPLLTTSLRRVTNLGTQMQTTFDVPIFRLFAEGVFGDHVGRIETPGLAVGADAEPRIAVTAVDEALFGTRLRPEERIE